VKSSVKVGERCKQPRVQAEAPANPKRSRATNNHAILVSARVVVAGAPATAPTFAEGVDSDAVVLAQGADPVAEVEHGVRTGPQAESLDRNPDRGTRLHPIPIPPHLHHKPLPAY